MFGDKENASPVRPVSCGLQVPGEQGISCKNTKSSVNFPRSFLHQNVLQFHQQTSVKLGVDTLAFWKIINDVDAFLIPKISGENISRDFVTRKFLGGAG